MKLYLSKAWHLGADYINEEGKVLYRVQTNSRLHPTTTHVSSRLVHTLRQQSFLTPIHNGTEQIGDSEVEGRDDDTDPDWEDRFVHLARIDFVTFKPSRIAMGGQEVEVSSFFRKGDWGWSGRDRIFNGPDGREYKWLLAPRKLVVNDSTQAVVAKFHEKLFNFINHSRETTYLEITPLGEHMVDIILVTFLYIEKLRQDNNS
ncbi:hypothetical protein AX16_004169 [Volvariella volvacea WC 439]|nr:hypothetical protein AX16_004169 [Volvariella volvacea WC 439]